MNKWIPIIVVINLSQPSNSKIGKLHIQIICISQNPFYDFLSFLIVCDYLTMDKKLEINWYQHVLTIMPSNNYLKRLKYDLLSSGYLNFLLKHLLQVSWFFHRFLVSDNLVLALRYLITRNLNINYVECKY